MKIILALVLGIASTMANATVVTYKFTGVFDAPTRFAPRGDTGTEALFNNLIKAGDHFSGQFTFDTDAVAKSFAPAPNNWAVYPELDFQLGVSATFNAAFPSLTASQLQVTDNGLPSTGNYDELIAFGGARLDSQHTLSVVLRMDPGSNRAFNNFRVPDGFDGFTGAAINVYLYHYDAPIFDHIGGAAKVTLADPAAVPEPATALLLLAGLGAVTASRRKK